MKWRLARHGRFTNNWVHDNLGVGVWADYNNIEILFEGNYIADNHDVGIFYEISYNFMIRYNTIVRNTLETGAAANDSFPNGGIYISESGGVNVPGYLYGISEIHHNYFGDNRDGIAIWESGNRYDGSDAYSNDPAYGDATHWKSQNILVHDNEFHMNKAVAGCSGNRYCGRNGVFSEWACRCRDQPYLPTLPIMSIRSPYRLPKTTSSAITSTLAPGRLPATIRVRCMTGRSGGHQAQPDILIQLHVAWRVWFRPGYRQHVQRLSHPVAATATGKPPTSSTAPLTSSTSALTQN